MICRLPKHTFLAGLVLAGGLMMTRPPDACAQARGIVTGRVVEAETGDPLPGANVLIQGTNTGVATNRQGRFRLTGVPNGEQTLVASFVGYQDTMATVTVRPGETLRQDFELASIVFETGEVVVQGLREGQVRSISQKREAVNLTEVLSADEAGKLPDLNVAEALQRVPGLSIQTDNNEGRFVSIRGTAPELNNVTLNGQTLASTTSSRATALDLLPTEMISSIEVVKAITPDMDGEAIGGSVNLNTISAFDRNRPFVFGTFYGLNHDQQVDYLDEDFPYRASLTAGTQFGRRNQFGLVVSGSASQRDFTTSVLDPDGWIEAGDFLIPNELESQVEDNERDRYGLSANLDFRPTENTSLYVRSLYTRTEELTSNSEFEITFEGELVNQTPTTGDFTQGSVELDLSEGEEIENLYSFELGGEQRFGSLLWTVEGAYSRGLTDIDDAVDATFETPGDSATAVNSAASYDIEPYFFVVDPVDDAYIGNPSNYPLRGSNLINLEITEDTYVAGTDLRFDTEFGAFPGYLQAGGKVRLRDKVVDRSQFEYDPTEAVPTLAAFFLPATGTVQGGSEAFVHGDVAEYATYFRNNLSEASLFELDVEETELEEVEADSDNRENVYAAYGMGSVELGKLTALAGLRVEVTDTEVQRFEAAEDEVSGDVAVSSLTFDNSYTNWMPSVHLTYRATDRLVLRAAWTNTIGRPDYNELAGFREFAFEETTTPGVFQGGVEEGNPDLEPFEAMNVDLFGEYYFQGGGLLALGGFYKRIDNPIYEFDVTERDVEFEGRFFEEIRFRQDRNADDGTVYGLEATYQQLFLFLPSPFDGFGLSSNLAVIESEVSVPGREDEVPFFGQSDLVFNLTPYYQKYGFEARLAWSFQSDYLREDGIGAAPAFDRYQDKRSTLDLSASYELGRFVPGQGSVKVLAQVNNVTNEPETQFQGVDSRYDRHVLTGRTFSLGVSASF